MTSTHTLKQALISANLSPSSHNCQPWMTVIIDSEDKQLNIQQTLSLSSRPRIIFGLDKTRTLTSLPIHSIEMHLSCGAYIQAFLEALGPSIAASTLWVSTQANSNIASIELPENFIPLMILAFHEEADPTTRPYYTNQLASRRTHRLEYKKIPLQTAQLDCLRDTQSHLDPHNSLGLKQTIITDGTRINQFCHCISQNAGKEFTHPTAWKETYAYFRWNEEHAKQQGDGFTLSHVLGPMPKFMTWIVKCILYPTTMKLLSVLQIPKLLAKDMSRKFQSSDAIFLLSFPTDEPSIQDQIIAGSYLLNFWLRADSQGLSLWPCSILLQHDSSRKQLESSLDVEGRLYFVGKIGTPKQKLSPAPRHSDPLNNVRCI